MFRHEETALERLFTGVVHREHGRVVRLIPTAREIGTALLHPADEIGGTEAIRARQRGVIGREGESTGAFSSVTRKAGAGP